MTTITQQSAEATILEHITTHLREEDIYTLLGLDDGVEISAEEERAAESARYALMLHLGLGLGL